MSKSRSSQPIAITPGEPAGIGPEICIQAHREVSERAELVYFADPDMMRDRAAAIGIDVVINDLDKNSPVSAAMNVFPVRLARSSTPGTPDIANADYVISCLDAALSSCLSGELAALVTGPINKAIINEAGMAFSGHTEWLAEQTNTPRVVMMLTGGKLRVALATTHLPLKDVSAAITEASLRETIEILHRDLVTRFGIREPRILVCGLNPHAGESGHLGTEEITVIQPVLEQFRRQGLIIEGPLPADTAFTRPCLERCDVVLAMYHDQGLPVLKHAAFGQAVNITLGLPIIRTSVDHGTAFDLAGTGQADSSSLVCAIDSALRLAGGKP